MDFEEFYSVNISVLRSCRNPFTLHTTLFFDTILRNAFACGPVCCARLRTSTFSRCLTSHLTLWKTITPPDDAQAQP